MLVHFATPSLAALDQLRCEVLALPLFSDERPLAGIGGLVDWRLCGLLSRWVAAGRITGAAAETVLVASRGRLPMDRVLLFGLGARGEFDAARLRERLRAMLDAVRGSGARSAALCLPGRHVDAIDPATAMQALIEATDARPPREEMVLLEGHDAQREMEPVIERARRKRRAQDYA